MWTQQADVFAKYFRNLDAPQGKNVLFTNFHAEYQSLFYVFTPNNFEQGSYSKFYTKCKPSIMQHDKGCNSRKWSSYPCVLGWKIAFYNCH